jgi:hypothetical protein
MKQIISDVVKCAVTECVGVVPSAFKPDRFMGVVPRKLITHRRLVLE